jgi:hypothetical protein
MGKHDTSDDRDWFERNQERSHRAYAVSPANSTREAAAIQAASRALPAA